MIKHANLINITRTSTTSLFPLYCSPVMKSLPSSCLCYFVEALVSRMDTTSPGDVEHEEVWRYCFQRQGFQKCYWLLYEGFYFSLIIAFLFYHIVFSHSFSLLAPCICHFVEQPVKPFATLTSRVLCTKQTLHEFN